MSKSLEELASKMKKATSNAKICANDAQLHKDICDLTYNDSFTDTIIKHIFDGLGNQMSKNYYQLYNLLLLVEYLLLNGHEALAEKFSDFLPHLFKLKSYKCPAMPNIGLFIRDKTTRIINLFNNSEQLCKERVQLFEERNKAAFLPGVANEIDKSKEVKALKDDAINEITDILSKIDIEDNDKKHILSSLIDSNGDKSVLDNYADDITPKQLKRLNDIKTKIESLQDTMLKETKNETEEQLSTTEWITKTNSRKRSKSVVRFAQDESDLRNRSVSSHTSTSSKDSSTVSKLGSRRGSESVAAKTERYIIIDGSNVAFK